MHTSELIELAAIAAVQASSIITSRRRLPFAALAEYWSASKCRLDRWSRSLKQLSSSGFTEMVAPGRFGTRRQWLDEPRRRPDAERLDAEHSHQTTPEAQILESTAPEPKVIVEEILQSEVLTRVWAAVLSGYDSHWGTSDAEPIGRSVLMGHLEARHRALTLLMQGPGINSHDALELNRLRRRAERWADLLLGHVLLVADSSELAFDADLAREFADELRAEPAWQPGGGAWSLALSSLKASFPRPKIASRQAELNARIGAAVLACFPQEVFDSAGVPLPGWVSSATWPRGAMGGVRGVIDQLFRSPAGHHQNSVRTKRMT
jgi:hypothetical protein